ncbi:unnamed protein product, partial [Vitis vinifera]|uniref:Uncharacterized protein n=1 Tax=Vitis vinifera TaxID=29760 RepID=D7TKY1_VITVI
MIRKPQRRIAKDVMKIDVGVVSKESWAMKQRSRVISDACTPIQYPPTTSSPYLKGERTTAIGDMHQHSSSIL